eukprot:6147191-Alexandrium_andersonii.AAC.1
MKRRGESVQPCLTPLSWCFQSEHSWFILTLNCGALRRALSTSVVSGPSPASAKSSSISFLYTLSKAFSQSRNAMWSVRYWAVVTRQKAVALLEDPNYLRLGPAFGEALTYRAGIKQVRYFLQCRIARPLDVFRLHLVWAPLAPRFDPS